MPAKGSAEPFPLPGGLNRVPLWTFVRLFRVASLTFIYILLFVIKGIQRPYDLTTVK
jgi:hypothetical protein